MSFQDLVGKMKDAAKSLEKATQSWGLYVVLERFSIPTFTSAETDKPCIDMVLVNLYPTIE